MINAFLPKESLLKSILLASIFFSILVLVLFGMMYHTLPPQIPLFYSNPWGKAQLAPPYGLALPIVLSIVFLFINSILSTRLFHMSFVRHTLFIGAIVTLVLSAITVIRILFLIR